MSVLLIDFQNFAYRANISFAPKDDALKDNAVEDYNIVYNFFRSFRALVELFAPSKIFFCLEGRPTKRLKLYSNYKANRLIKIASKKEKDLERFHRQKGIIISLLKYFPITMARADEWEADDVIATLADNLNGEETIVVSTDSDFIQLLQKGYKAFKLYNPIKKEFIEAPDWHYVAGKSLFGDKSDNIPGLMNEEKAIELLSNPNEFELFLSAEENRAQFTLNRKLIELGPIPDDDLILEQFLFEPAIVKKEFEKMELKTMVVDKYWERFSNTFRF